MSSTPSSKSIYILTWGLAGFILTMIGWKYLIIPIEAALGLLPDISLDSLWQAVGWGISAGCFAVGIIILMGFILEPWGPRGQLFKISANYQGRFAVLITAALLLTPTFTMLSYWQIGPQGTLIGILHLVWGWTAILSALGIVVGFAGIKSNLFQHIVHFFNRFWEGLIKVNPTWLVVGISCWLLFITSTVSWKIFGAIPHVGDSVCQIFVAKTFLHGQLWAQPPPTELKPFFFETFLNDDLKWFPEYLPGFSLLMVPFVLIKATWLLNPLLTALTIPLAFWIGKSVADERVGRYTVFAMAFCPFIIFLAGGQMNHPATLFWGCLAVLSVLKLSSTNQRYWGIVAGLSMGMGIITRPLTGLSIALPAMLYWLNDVWRKSSELNIDRDFWLRQLGFIVLGAAPPLIFLLIYNHATTGNMFVTGYSVVWQGHTTLGFGPSSWGEPHTPCLGLLNTINNLNGLNRYLYEIPIPTLVGLLLYAIFHGFGRKEKGYTFAGKELLLTIIFTLVAAYFFYFFQDFCYGPRFTYELVVALLIISIIGIRSFISAVESLGHPRTSIRAGIIFYGLLCVILALIFSIPRQISIYRDIYWDISRQVLDEVDHRKIDNAIVFIEDFPSTNRHDKLHTLGLGNRDAWFWARRITDQDLDAALRELGLDPEMAWTPVPELDKLWLALNKHRGKQPSPLEDAPGGKRFTPYDSGLMAMDPHWASNSVIYARDLGKYDQVLIDRFPDRTIWRYAWDNFTGAFSLKPYQPINNEK
jgi:hypothetical protein